MSQAVLLHKVLDSECLTPTLVLYTSAICKVRKNWRLALGLFQEIAGSSLEANDFSYGATISACERGVPLTQSVQYGTIWYNDTCAIGVFQAPGFENFGSLRVQHSVSKAQWLHAISLLRQRKPDLPSFNATCSACRGVAWTKALQLMRTDLRLRLNVVSVLGSTLETEQSLRRFKEWQAASPVAVRCKVF